MTDYTTIVTPAIPGTPMFEVDDDGQQRMTKVWQQYFIDLKRVITDPSGDLTASRIVATDSSGVKVSVSDLTSWIAGVANRITITDDGDGTVTITIPDTPTLVGMILSSLTASRLVASDGNKNLISSAISNWIAGTANQITVTDDGDGSITISIPSDLNIPGDLTFVGDGDGLAFAGISVKDNTDAVTLNSAAKDQVTNFDTNDPSNNATPDHTNDHITTDKKGDYFAIISLDVQNNAAQAHKVDVSLWKNNGATEFLNVHNHRNLSGGSTDVASMSLSGFIEVAAGDTLEIWADTGTAGDRSVTFEDITLSILQVGG